MTIDHELGSEDIAQETAVLDRLAERRAAMEADAPPVIPPCPSWCISAAELHPLDFDREGGAYVRTHEAFMSDLVHVEVTERSDGRGGPVTLSQPEFRIYGADLDGETATPAEMFVLVAAMQRAQAVLDQLTAPTVPPPCPSWCARPAGHPYANVAHKYNGSPVFERDHSAHPEGEVSVDVVATEHYLRGKVDVDEPMAVFIDVEASRWYGIGLRELAGDMLEAAELLDRITAEQAAGHTS